MHKKIYSGTPLLWTPWGPGEVSCIERCPHFRGKFTLGKHIWDTAKCPYYRGVLISGVSFKRGSTVSLLRLASSSPTTAMVTTIVTNRRIMTSKETARARMKERALKQERTLYTSPS